MTANCRSSIGDQCHCAPALFNVMVRKGMAVPVRPLLAIGLASAGIGVTLAVAAAPQAAATPTTSGTPSTTSTNHRSYSTGSQHLVRKSATATPSGGYTAGSGSSTVTTSQSHSSTSSTAKSAATTGFAASSTSRTTSTSRTSASASSRTATSSSSAQGSVPTSNAFVSSSNEATQGAAKHHWGTHHGHPGHRGLL